MAGMTAAAVVTAAMAVIMIVVIATDTRIIIQFTGQEGLHSIVSIALDTAVKLDTRIGQIGRAHV